jgi:hypothetical protein
MVNTKYRLFILAIFIYVPFLVFSQFNNNTSSPYSRYALGDIQPYGFGRLAGMGGASFASRNGNQINSANPASYTSIDSLVFLFEFGANGKFSRYSNDLTGISTNDVNFRYFAMNFRITNWMATSLGLLPYSDVGYNVSVTDSIANTGRIGTLYSGYGSISKAYFGLAVQPFKYLSLGANLNYMFGLLTRSGEVYFLDAADFYLIQKHEKLRIRDFSLNYGLQSIIPVGKNQRLTIAGIFENKPEFTAFKYEVIQKNLSTENFTDQDTLNANSQEVKGKIRFPLSYGAGISYVVNDKLEFNADYYHQKWSQAKFFGAGSTLLTDLDKFAIGGEWIPEKYSIRSYMKRVAYRAGMKYEKSYLLLNNQQINDFGISFGVGLPVYIPMYRSSSLINVAAEIGRRGTKKNNLVAETYAKIDVSVNLMDFWFMKRKID